jgi:hypothetical protein
MSPIDGERNEGTYQGVNGSSDMLEGIDPGRGETRLMTCVSIVEGKTQMSDSAEEEDEDSSVLRTLWERFDDVYPETRQLLSPRQKKIMELRMTIDKNRDAQIGWKSVARVMGMDRREVRKDVQFALAGRVRPGFMGSSILIGDT